MQDSKSEQEITIEFCEKMRKKAKNRKKKNGLEKRVRSK